MHPGFEVAVALGVHFGQGNEAQAGAVDAVAQAAFVFGAVVKDVAQVRVGGAAAHFHAAHVVAVVFVFGDSGSFYGAGEAGLAAAAVVFVGRAEKWLAADHVHEIGRAHV